MMHKSKYKVIQGKGEVINHNVHTINFVDMDNN